MPVVRAGSRRRARVGVIAIVAMAAILAGAYARFGGEDEIAVALVKEIEPGAISGNPSDLTVLDDTLYFLAGRDLWRSDGTDDGTTPVTTIAAPAGDPGDEWSVDGLVAAGEALYFWHWDQQRAHGFELWRSDGTAAGTTRVARLPRRGARPSAGAITPVGDGLSFLYDDGTAEESLWLSDGAEAGTRPVATIGIGVGSGAPGQDEITVVGDALYFPASVDGGRNIDLWRFDTATGRAEVAVDAYPMQKVALGDALYFITPVSDTAYELWRTDGTEAGTTTVARLGNTTLFELAVAGDGLFILAPETAGGEALWWSDGTAAGTRRLSDFPDGWSLRGLVAAGETAYFLAQEDADGAALELWRSEGSTEGAHRIGETGLGVVREVVAAGDALYFTGEDDEHGNELWSYEIAGSSP